MIKHDLVPDLLARILTIGMMGILVSNPIICILYYMRLKKEKKNPQVKILAGVLRSLTL